MLVVVPATKKGIHNNFQKFSFPAFSFLTLYRNIIIQMIELLELVLQSKSGWQKKSEHSRGLEWSA